jgi:hypothetical protein
MENLLEKPGVRNYIKKDQIFKALGWGGGRTLDLLFIMKDL